MTYHPGLQATQQIYTIPGDTVAIELSENNHGKPLSAEFFTLDRIEREHIEPFRLRAVIRTPAAARLNADTIIMWPADNAGRRPLPDIKEPAPIDNDSIGQNETVITYTLPSGAILNLICERVRPPIAVFTVYAPANSIMSLTVIGCN